MAFSKVIAHSSQMFFQQPQLTTVFLKIIAQPNKALRMSITTAARMARTATHSKEKTKKRRLW